MLSSQFLRLKYGFRQVPLLEHGLATSTTGTDTPLNTPPLDTAGATLPLVNGKGGKNSKKGVTDTVGASGVKVASAELAAL